jgi:hypothetical protein
MTEVKGGCIGRLMNFTLLMEGFNVVHPIECDLKTTILFKNFPWFLHLLTASALGTNHCNGCQIFLKHIFCIEFFIVISLH